MSALDMSDAFDPLYVDAFSVIRRYETVVNGRTVLNPETITGLWGTFCAASANDLATLGDSRSFDRAFSIVTKAHLKGAEVGYQPDLVLWLGSQYLVVRVEPYPHLGPGFFSSDRGVDHNAGARAMSVINSSGPGFLTPSPDIAYDQQLEDQLSPTIAGITGLATNLVRPRFQEDPPIQPDRSVNWVAFGVMRTLSDNFVTVAHTTDNISSVIRYHEFEVLLSFYGPLASSYCEIFRDGLLIGQNRDLLTQNDIGVVEIGESRKAPALFKEKWLTKYDMSVTFRRRTERSYPVLSIGSADITIITEP